ncbi:MAG: hypothetical protein NNA22_05820 [Nitrospira sp.]|nr:hypothetical protein [Nitrospira sp.]
MNIQGVRLISDGEKDMPQRQAVFAAGDGDKDTVVFGKHRVRCDRPIDLIVHEADETRTTERGMMAGYFNDGAASAFHAIHDTVILRIA